ncbi:MAG TPA: hypothetical protein VNO86_10525 [Candidatus Binatia bacterium]|nr:hypothetical protein [Candidatus Binatia bacterium]
MVEGELADLAVDPGAVESDRTWCSPERCDHGPDRGVVELDPGDLPEDRLLPRLVAVAGLLTPRVAWARVELPMASVSERPVALESPAASAEEQPAEQVHPGPAMRPSALGPGAPHFLDPRPQLVGHGWVRPPGGGLAALAVGPSVPPDPAVVQRVHQDHPDAAGRKAGLGLELGGAHVAQGVPLEQRHRCPDGRWVDLEGVWRLGQASEAEARVPAWVVTVVELRRVAVGDPLGEAAAVLLRARRLRDELVPVVRVGGQDPPVAHDEGDASGVQAVLEELQRPPQVALPAVGVASQEEVEGAGPRLREHLGHRRRAPHRRAAVGDLEDEARVHEAVAVDEAVLLLALAGRPEAVVLAGRRLADPAGDAQSTDVVERPG